MTLRSRTLVLTALLATLPACRRPAEARDPVLLALDGQEIHRRDFEQHVARLEQRGGAPLDPAVRQAVLASFLEERVLVLAARGRGLVAAGAGPEEEQQAVQLLLAQTALSGLAVSDPETEAYYQAHLEAFAEPERVTLRQVLLPSASEAQEVRRRVQKDPKQFDLVARAASRGPEAAQGGFMGTFARGELPAELEAPAFSLGVGAVSEVVQSPLGFHVLRVEARQPARTRPLEECREEVRARLAREKTDRAVHDYVQGLLARAKVNHDAQEPAPRRS